MQSGQLDAASAFVTQAIELHLDYIPLVPQINLCCAQYAAQYKAGGFSLPAPKVFGTASSVPSAISSELGT